MIDDNESAAFLGGARHTTGVCKGIESGVSHLSGSAQALLYRSPARRGLVVPMAAYAVTFTDARSYAPPPCLDTSMPASSTSAGTRRMPKSLSEAKVTHDILRRGA